MLRRMMMADGGGGPYLDALPVAPLRVFSLKKLISTASVVVRIRRSNDDSELDIGFSGDALDISALAAFVGENSGYVVKFYDQTGSGNDLIQSTKSKQPRIVTSGVYAGIANWDGLDDAMSISGLPLSQPQLGIYFDGVFPSSVGVTMLFELSANWNSNSYCALLNSQSGTYEAGMNSSNPSLQRAQRYSLGLNSQGVLAALFDRSMSGTSEISAWVNGVSKSASVASGNEQDGSFTTHDMHVGARSGSTFFSALQQKSMVIYNADTSIIRSSIEAIVA